MLCSALGRVVRKEGVRLGWVGGVVVVCSGGRGDVWLLGCGWGGRRGGRVRGAREEPGGEGRCGNGSAVSGGSDGVGGIVVVWFSAW